MKSKTAVKKPAPKMPPVKKTKTGVTWQNKTIDKFDASSSEGHVWVAQLSKCSDGRTFRSVKQLITKRDGTEVHINGFVFKNEPTGSEIIGMMKLMLKVLPKGAKLLGLKRAVQAAIDERAA